MNTIAQAFAKVLPAPAVIATVGAVSPSDLLDKITFDPKARASINYVKARIAIEAAYPNRKIRRSAKLVVIEHLNGQLVHPKVTPPQKTPLPNFVLFEDSSKARF